MGLFDKLFRPKKNRVTPHSLEELAHLFQPDNIDPNSDYALTSNISSLIDASAAEEGPNSLDSVYIILFTDGRVGSVYSEKSLIKENDYKAVFCLKDYPLIQVLKACAGKRDDMSYMTVDLAGRDILERLRAQQ